MWVIKYEHEVAVPVEWRPEQRLKKYRDVWDWIIDKFKKLGFEELPPIEVPQLHPTMAGIEVLKRGEGDTPLIKISEEMGEEYPKTRRYGLRTSSGEVEEHEDSILGKIVATGFFDSLSEGI